MSPFAKNYSLLINKNLLENMIHKEIEESSIPEIVLKHPDDHLIFNKYVVLRKHPIDPNPLGWVTPSTRDELKSVCACISKKFLLPIHAYEAALWLSHCFYSESILSYEGGSEYEPETVHDPIWLSKHYDIPFEAAEIMIRNTGMFDVVCIHDLARAICETSKKTVRSRIIKCFSK